MIDKPEYVLCAAIWYMDFNKAVYGPVNVDRGVVLCGRRHVEIVHQHVAMMGKRSSQMGKYEQGFLTNKNRFVSREEALLIAISQNQIPKEEYKTKTRLFSEDLY